MPLCLLPVQSFVRCHEESNDIGNRSGVRNPLHQLHNIQAEEPQRMLRGRGDAHAGITFATGEEYPRCAAFNCCLGPRVKRI